MNNHTPFVSANNIPKNAEANQTIVKYTKNPSKISRAMSNIIGPTIL